MMRLSPLVVLVVGLAAGAGAHAFLVEAPAPVAAVSTRCVDVAIPDLADRLDRIEALALQAAHPPMVAAPAPAPATPTLTPTPAPVRDEASSARPVAAPVDADAMAEQVDAAWTLVDGAIADQRWTTDTRMRLRGALAGLPREEVDAILTEVTTAVRDGELPSPVAGPLF